MRRVVVTGLGAVTPIGCGADGLWQGVLAERSAVRRIRSFNPCEFNCHIAAEIDDFRPEERLDPKRIKRLDRYSKLALVAGMMAIDDAGLGTVDPNRAGVTVGSALGGIACAEEEMGHYLAGGLRAVNPMLALSVFGGAASCNLAIELGWFGFNTANSDSCASSPVALGNALNAIRRGDADVILAGGAEAPLYPLTFGAFSLIRAMSQRNHDPEQACRPFDAARDGFVMAEGAAFLVLEERERALRRRARIYCELAGFGLTNDGSHMTAPRTDGEQAARAMSLALHDAATDPSEIDYINAHGSSTPLNDSTETTAIKKVFEGDAYRIPVSGTKSMHGHSLGATGAIEAAICCLAFANGWIPPTVNLHEPQAGLDLDFVPRHGRSCQPRAILSNSFGFGGINAAVVFRKD
ncbi:MAG TPA: beta-ketoacyl-[acyl-carrier-protein] synthase family protein [Fimbriimonas sp.]